MPMQSHLDVVSPPISGRSTPKAHVPNVMPRGQETSFMHKYHTVNNFSLYTHCLKITQNVAFEFFDILAFSTNFCPIKTDLSGNTV